MIAASWVRKHTASKDRTMATNPDTPRPDRIEPQSPPERPPVIEPDGVPPVIQPDETPVVEPDQAEPQSPQEVPMPPD